MKTMRKQIEELKIISQKSEYDKEIMELVWRALDKLAHTIDNMQFLE